LCFLIAFETKIPFPFFAGDASTNSCSVGIVHSVLWSHVSQKRVICSTSKTESGQFRFRCTYDTSQRSFPKTTRSIWFSNFTSIRIICTSQRILSHPHSIEEFYLVFQHQTILCYITLQLLEHIIYSWNTSC
jgi:hypothetical protein